LTRARDVANVLSIATSLATDAETATAISNHNSSTTSVHGISDTTALATQTYVQNNKGINKGNTASRPESPANGDLYYNTETSVLEVYDAGWWIPNTTPGIPTSVSATNQPSGRAYNNGSASVSFTPETSGGKATSYTVTSSPGSYTASGASSPLTITGLQSSTQYTYTVTATGPLGTSAASTASAGVTATTVPQAPTIGTATGTGDGSGTATVTFTAGSTGGSAITSFTATSSPGSLTASGASSPITISGLTLDTPYTFTTTATNSNGISLSSLPSNSITSTLALSSFDAIASTTLTSSQAAISFNSIPQDYKHLQIRWVGATVGGDYMYIKSNNFPTKSSRMALLGTDLYNSANYNADATYGTEMWFGGIDVSEPASGIIDILDYSSTTKVKQAKILLVRPHSTGPYNSLITLINQFGTSTSAINSITFQSKPSYPLCAGTTVSLYGIKG